MLALTNLKGESSLPGNAKAAGNLPPRPPLALGSRPRADGVSRMRTRYSFLLPPKSLAKKPFFF